MFNLHKKFNLLYFVAIEPLQPDIGFPSDRSEPLRERVGVIG